MGEARRGFYHPFVLLVQVKAAEPISLATLWSFSARTGQREHESEASLDVDLIVLYHMGSLVCEWLDVGAQVLFPPSSRVLLLVLPFWLLRVQPFGCKSTTSLRPPARNYYLPSTDRSSRAACCLLVRTFSVCVARSLPL